MSGSWFADRTVGGHRTGHRCTCVSVQTFPARALLSGSSEAQEHGARLAPGSRTPAPSQRQDRALEETAGPTPGLGKPRMSLGCLELPRAPAATERRCPWAGVGHELSTGG